MTVRARHGRCHRLPTERQWEVDPTRNEDAIEVTMRYDDDVSRAFAVLEPFAMVFTNLWIISSKFAGKIGR